MSINDEVEELEIPLEEFLLSLVGKAKNNHFIFLNVKGVK